VTDPRGQKVLEQVLKPDALGGADAEVKLNEKAATGSYTLSLTRAEMALTRHFRVEEYRVPNFEVKVEMPDNAPDATVEGRYLHGGAMPGRQVKWELTADPEAVRSAGVLGLHVRHRRQPRLHRRRRPDEARRQTGSSRCRWGCRPCRRGLHGG